jgi:hypothetical protein
VSRDRVFDRGRPTRSPTRSSVRSREGGSPEDEAARPAAYRLPPPEQLPEISLMDETRNVPPPIPALDDPLLMPPEVEPAPVVDPAPVVPAPALGEVDDVPPAVLDGLVEVSPPVVLLPPP